MSPPTRVVWIEIFYLFWLTQLFCVTTHTGGVDWNIFFFISYKFNSMVTTHTGGVDWNLICNNVFPRCYSHHPHGWCGLKLPLLREITRGKEVTTHTGGVDWNFNTGLNLSTTLWSPPTRVVWIEIRYGYACRWQGSVTTHTGGVDWNKVRKHYQTLWKMSPPTRVVWIEIAVQIDEKQTESRHHPHGWCGLKSYRLPSLNFVSGHHPHGWCGLKLFLNRLER